MKKHESHIQSILVIGDSLLSLDSKGKVIIWSLPNGTVEKEFEVSPTKNLLMHPPTYVYKVLIAGQNEIELWNVKSGKLIYEFPGIKESLNSAIQTIEEAGVVDMAAIGLSSGRVLITNLKTDKVLYTYEAGSRITSLSFSSSESGIEYSLLAGSTIQGEIILWDLNAKRIHCSWKAHHEKCVNKVGFLPGEPILMSSSGEDNSLKSWVIEKGQIHPRLLRAREGADQPASYVKFYGEDGKNLLAACGKNTILQSVSLISDHQNCSFPIKPLLKQNHKEITRLTKANSVLDQ